MSGELAYGEEAALAEAGDWLVRLTAPNFGEPGLSEDEALAFDAWLDASPLNAAAYDRMVTLSHAIDDAAPDILAALPLAERRRTRQLLGRRGFLAAGGFAAAAMITLAIAPSLVMQPTVETYATGVGEHRTLKLADGSTIDMNSATRLSVSFAKDGRRIVMPEGEAIFDVAHDTARPFTIAAGDHTVRVVGTQFDVRRRAEGLSVTVARGIVEVRPTGDVAGQTWRLVHGQRLDLPSAGQPQVQAVEASDVFSWREGRLIYRDQTLADVVADLNRQYPRQIAIADPELAATKVSGVLVLDNQADVVQRLTLMLPLSALPSDGGLLLHRK